jgi:subtilase family serine protease
VATPTPTPPPGTPAGYGPSDLHAAYSLPGLASGDTTGTGQTIAIVDAFDDPTAENDLNVYRAQFGLSACTTANGCFRKADQSGGTSYPAVDTGWAQEISLDIDMVSAICPNCKILLVEANSNSFNDLAASVDTAAALGANAISNSYGGSESLGSVSFDSHYNHAGVAITASSGDNGFGTQSPASAKSVVAVGGTSLTAGTWAEIAWSGAGSGCSRYNTMPAWQTGVVSGCTRRGEADVSAVADPNTGVAVYDSTPNGGASGWLVFGGTSVASPVIASVFGLAANAATIMATGSSASYEYAHVSGNLKDITAGTNGFCLTAVCRAGPGWDGPTGLGTPRGTGAF